MKFEELPDWNFTAEELSANVFEVRGSDREGRSVSFSGCDPDALLDQARQNALEMLSDKRTSGS